jgi:ubiquinone/menaquinone biosynthesis C-methylase UbiE
MLERVGRICYKIEMSTYYTGRRARRYNARWRTFSERTLAEALAMIDIAALRSVPERLDRSPRMLDVACGTGLLLSRLLDRLPGAEAYGVDGSEDMLAQARTAMKVLPHVHLERVQVGEGPTAGLPFAQETFELITCTNALHDLPEPVGTLSGLRRLLSPGGQLVVEDFARRERPFPWTAFEWLLHRIEGSPVHAYTLAEAQSLCQQAGLSLARGKAFKVDWFWRGWVVRACRTPPESGPARM